MERAATASYNKSIVTEKLPGAAKPECHQEMSRDKGYGNDKKT